MTKISIYDLRRYIEKIKEEIGYKEFTINNICPIFPQFSTLRISHMLRKSCNYGLIQKSGKLKVRNSNKSDKSNSYRYVNKYIIVNKGG